MESQQKDSSIQLGSRIPTTAATKKEVKRRQDDGWGGEGMHGYMKEKERKLEEQFLGLNDYQKKSNIFKGVCIFVNGYTNPSSDHLKLIMAEHGGHYQHYYSMKSCTHIIATNLPDSKVKGLKNEKVVHPDWIVDSVKAGTLLPIDKYRLYKGMDRTKESAFASFKHGAKYSRDVEMEDLNIDKDVQIASAVDSVDEEMVGNKLRRDTNSLFQKYDKQGTDFYEKSRPSVDETVSFSQSARKEAEVNLSGPLEDDIYCGLNQRHDCITSDPINKDDNSCSNMSVKDEYKDFSEVDAGESKVDDKNKHRSDSYSSIVGNSCTSEAGNCILSKGDDIKTKHSMEDTENHCECEQDISDKDVNSKVSESSRIALPNLTKHDYSNAMHTKSMGKAGNPGFMSDYYSNSRLHHLSMWKNELRRFATMIHRASSKRRSVKATKKRSEQCFMHIDMDSFFVSVALKEKPELIGKPIAVCHASKGATSSVNINSMSEIASCSYEARSMGVRNGMFLGPARVKCPELVCVPYYFESYRTVSQKFYEILCSYTSEIEAVSCDEALLEISDLIGEENSAIDLASRIRKDIQQATGCTASAGIACNILLARMATRKVKPNGQFHLQKENITEFIECQKVSDLPGVGYSMRAKLTEIGVSTCGDLKQVSLQKLQTKFGPRTGQSLFNFCRGIDDRQLKTDHERQSVSAEINYGIRFTQQNEPISFLGELAKEVHERLVAIETQGSHITLKLMIRAKGAPEPSKHMGHGICDNISKSVTISQPTDNSSIIARETINLLQQLNVSASDIRGMGIQISKLIHMEPSSKSVKKIDFSRAKPLSTSTVACSDVMKDGPEKIIPVKEKDSVSKGKGIIRKRDRKPGQKSGNIIGSTGLTITKFAKKAPESHSVKSNFISASSTEVSEPPLPSLNFSPVKQTVNNQGEAFSLPPVSDVDPAVFNELPDDVRESIVEAYKQRNQLLDIKGPSLLMPRVDSSPSSRSNRLKRKLSRRSVYANKKKKGSAMNVRDKEVEYQNRNKYSGSLITLSSSEVLKDNENLRESLYISNDRIGYEKRGYENVVKDSMKYEVSRNEEILSESLIDPEVMESLPENLRNEILMSIKLDKRKQNSKQMHHDGMEATKGYREICESDVIAKEKKEAPSLLGKSKYEDVKILIREWINSTDEPLSEDLEEVRLYLQDLVCNRKMEQAYLILKMFKRLSKKSAHWITSWDGFQIQFQDFIKDTYGTELYI